MARIVYVNGEYVREDQARVSIFDRGYLFGDGAYEVIPVLEGQLVDVERMLARLDNSLAALGIEWPMDKDAYVEMHRELIRRNALVEGMIYSQVTRGVAERDFAFPRRALPSVIAFTKTLSIIDNPRAETGVSVAFVEDLRWKLRSVKSIALLAQVLAKEQAVEKHAFEGWMVEDGHVTEGTSSSAYIVKNGTIITHPLEGGHILPGIRRSVLLEIAEREGIPVDLRPFTPEEAQNADEAFASAATFGVLPVVEIEGRPVGNGEPGPITKRLRQAYLDHALAQVRAAD